MSPRGGKSRPRGDQNRYKNAFEEKAKKNTEKVPTNSQKSIGATDLETKKSPKRRPQEEEKETDGDMLAVFFEKCDFSKTYVLLK